MSNDGYVPFESDEAFMGYEELQKEVERREKMGRKDEEPVTVTGAGWMREQNRKILAGMLGVLPEQYRKAQYRITREHSKVLAGFDDYTIEFKYSNTLGTFIDTFKVTCADRKKVDEDLKRMNV